MSYSLFVWPRALSFSLCIHIGRIFTWGSCLSLGPSGELWDCSTPAAYVNGWCLLLRGSSSAHFRSPLSNLPYAENWIFQYLWILNNFPRADRFVHSINQASGFEGFWYSVWRSRCDCDHILAECTRSGYWDFSENCGIFYSASFEPNAVWQNLANHSAPRFLLFVPCR